MNNDTKTGMIALLLAGEMAGVAEAAPIYPVEQTDQLQPKPAELSDHLTGAAHRYPSLHASPVIVMAQAERQDPTTMPTQTQYIGGELQQMNMR